MLKKELIKPLRDKGLLKQQVHHRVDIKVGQG